MQDQRPEEGFEEIVGDTPTLKQMLKLAMGVSRSDAPVMIMGEAGSGKELIARAIHRSSKRRNESFVKVNCTTTADHALESDLFGQERGAAGNGHKVGHLELANQGMLFLDEIALVPLSLQDKLLRLLECQEFERLGSKQSIRVDVRLVATTKFDLQERVAEQSFRGDLYQRLNVFPIHVPPLRERRADIPLLTRYFAQKFARRTNKHIEQVSPETMSFLVNSDWPGNIRQLESLIERAVVSTDGIALQIPRAGPP